MDTENSRLILITDWNKYHEWPPLGGLRWMKFNSHKNGFKTAFKKAGGRVLVDEAEFFRCIEKNDAAA